MSCDSFEETRIPGVLLFSGLPQSSEPDVYKPLYTSVVVDRDEQRAKDAHGCW